ncbi:thiol peroxidase [Enterococcus rivorum]|uniref:2-Cys peroxiredoxin n=1 Tax=Enterococcus rivorum TaxID=762845 RepID=A0A1E5KUS4_9ENTE|nr:thiol peroxidase [Enterococcus rivorum]MBP2100512.1 thiol peroxidase [Enterococcus rivorum]OEH81636.1 2-Cys peroxiredoxin [Enterococcus rivorum]
MKVTKKGEELEVAGIQPKIGDSAPSFSLPNLSDEVVHLSDFVGKPVLLSVVPDIDTRICSIQTKRFNQEAGKVSGAKLITISNNTKEEQAKWCAAEGVDMEMLHDADLTFGQAYGLFIPEIGHLARAIFVIDKDGKIVYEEIVSEISHEPDYKMALEKLTSLV